MNRIKMNGTFKTLGVLLTVAIVACGLVLPQQALAALPAPHFMPGFPMLAGPQVIVMWTPVPGATKYHVYLNGQKIAEPIAMQFIAPAPEAGGKYSYQVTAVDASGAESPQSLPGVITVIVVEPPKGLAALPQGDRVVLRWSAAPGAVIYDVFKKIKGGADYTMISSSTQTRYDDTDVEAGIDYEYSVKSKDQTGKSSDFSPPVLATIMVAADDGAAGKHIPAKMHALPATILSRVEIPEYPSDVVIVGNSLIVSAQSLFIIENFKDPVTIPNWLPFLPGQKGFKGLFVSDDESILYATVPSQGEVWLIDIAKQAIVAKYKVPPPPKGPPTQDGTLYYLSGSKQVNRASKTYVGDVVVEDSGTLVVTDAKNARLVRLDDDGSFIETIGYVPGEELREDPAWAIDNPGFLSRTSDGSLVVASINSIQGFMPEGERRIPLGGLGGVFGKFSSLNGLAVDGKDRLYAVDLRAGNIQVFQKNDKFDSGYRATYMLTNSAKNGNPDLATPLQMAVDKDAKIVVVLESMAKRVAVLKLDWDNADPVTEEEE